MTVVFARGSPGEPDYFKARAELVSKTEEFPVQVRIIELIEEGEEVGLSRDDLQSVTQEEITE